MQANSMTLVTTVFVVLAVGAPLRGEESPPAAVAPFAADEAQQLQQQWAAWNDRSVIETNSIGMKLALMPPGEFIMGRTEEQFDELLDVVRNDAELKKNYGGFVTWSMLMMPAHRVRITQPFYLGTTEVTVGQFREFVEATGYQTEAEQGLNHGKPYTGRRKMSTWRRPMAWRNPPLVQSDDEPVMHLCWNDCIAFCEWLSEQEGVVYRLPTEAEWEYACRAGTTTPWSFGGLADVESRGGDFAIWSDTGQKFDRPQRVAQRKPNAFGLYDMHGNMWEYVNDHWHRFTYKGSPLNDPTGPEMQSEKNDQRRIIRGSSFDWGRWGGDSAYRMRITQRSNQHPHMSFRVAMQIPDSQGIPPAEDPDRARRREVRDPGADAEQVVAALETNTEQTSLPRELTVELPGEVKMPFVLIPAGTCLIGSNNGNADEQPVHRVVISKPFYMARYELTRAQWEAVMGPHEWLRQLTSGDNLMSGPTKAMNVLSWNDCQAFIQKLREHTSEHAFALPTEAQWEYACRAGSEAEYHFGNDESRLGQYAWYQGNMNWPGQPGYDGGAFYHAVGQKQPNRWGLYDMHGGVWEWCADRYDADYYFDSPLVDPMGPEAGRFRVLRGGSWFRYARYARSAYRRFFHPEGSGDGVTAWINDFGCRLVINPGETRTTAAVAPPEPSGPTEATTALSKSQSGVPSLQRLSLDPVLTVGAPGEWDDQTLGCLTVLHHEGTYFLYTGGTRYGQQKHIGMATSTDGIHWSKSAGNPLFAGSMPCAVTVGNQFRLYYVGKDDRGRHGLLMRTSADGFRWSAPTLVLAGGILDPYVLQVAEGQFHLYFCAGGKRTKNGESVWEFQNYVATSPDGIHWSKLAEPILPLGGQGAWDEASHAGPCVLQRNGQFDMWYLGSGDVEGKRAWRVGHATSPDGLRWTKSGETPVFDVGKEEAWDSGTLMSFDIVAQNNGILFWYAAAPTEHGDESKMRIQIGHGRSR